MLNKILCTRNKGTNFHPKKKNSKNEFGDKNLIWKRNVTSTISAKKVYNMPHTHLYLLMRISSYLLYVQKILENTDRYIYKCIFTGIPIIFYDTLYKCNMEHKQFHWEEQQQQHDSQVICLHCLHQTTTVELYFKMMLSKHIVSFLRLTSIVFHTMYVFCLRKRIKL